MRIAAAQINPTVGDFSGNIRLIKEYIGQAREAGARLVVFPEMAICGYPAKDLLCQRAFLDAVETGIAEIREQTSGIGVLLGAPVRNGGNLFNAALLIQDRDLVDYTAKSLLPEYDVFDERRYFTPGFDNRPVHWSGLRLGVTVCEDIWNVKGVKGALSYPRDPVRALGEEGVDLFINISASPYCQGKQRQRLDLARAIVSRYGRPFLYVNQVGGNDDLVFDGAGFLLNACGELVLAGREFEADFQIFDVGTVGNMPVIKPDWTEGPAQIYRALILGLRDYMRKTGFAKALVGLSGGIDSAVTAALAAAAIGRENVLGVTMPSRYSSRESVDDSRELARRLGIEFRVMPIEAHFQSFIEQFNPDGNLKQDLAEENIQARIRGNILMFISNREGHLVLTTGNKSETAVGYSTLYGDMAGGLAVLSDVSKTMVYELAAYINREDELIPNSIIEKAPSAELRPGQRDEDSLPPYPILDGILKAYLEDGCSVDEIVARGYAEPLTRRIVRLVERAEYKRRQAAPGLKVTPKAFGPGRRFPIAHRWIP